MAQRVLYRHNLPNPETILQIEVIFHCVRRLAHVLECFGPRCINEVSFQVEWNVGNAAALKPAAHEPAWHHFHSWVGVRISSDALTHT